MKGSLLLLVAIASSILLALVLAWRVDGGEVPPITALEPAKDVLAALAPDAVVPDEAGPDELAPSTLPSRRSLAALPAVIDLTGGLRATPRRVGVEGTVREGGTQRNIDALVRFVCPDYGERSARSVGGRYVILAIEPGDWRLTVQAPGYATWSTEVRIDEAPTVQTFEIELDRTPHLKIRFETPEGVELVQALREESELARKLDVIAVATSAPPGESLGVTLEDTYASFGKGTWKPTSRAGYDRDDAAPEHSGVLELAQPLPGWVSACVANSVLRTRYVQRGTDAVTFVISLDELRGNLGSLRLRVVDAESGEPLSNGRVGLHANGKFGMGEDVADPAGWIVFDGEAPGPRHLSIVMRGHEWVVEQVWIEAGRMTDLGTYRLNRPVSIRGRVVDAQGTPVKAWVSVFPLERYDATSRILDKFCWTSSRAGDFEVRPVGRRRYLLRVNDETWSGEPVLVDASTGPVEDVELTVVPGTPVTFRFDPSTSRGARLAIVDAEGRPVAERPIDAALRVKVRLAPGRYRALVELGSERLAERAIEVGTTERDEFF